MLYKEHNFIAESNSKTDFIFDRKPYNQDINISEVAAIEGFLKKNGYIPQKYISTFLNWLIYKARIEVTGPIESPLDSSFAGKCSTSQSFFNQILQKFELSHFNFNVGDVLETNPIHALTGIIIPTIEEGKEINKVFILDPTFRQFCLTEENRYERYNEEPRWSVRMSTPHPGYFFNLTEKGKTFAEDLIEYGYFEATDDNLKTYLDPFALYVTPKEYYEDPELVGRLSTTPNSGSYYKGIINEVSTDKFIKTYGFNIDTPMEVIEREKNKFSNRVKKFFGHSELEQMFTIDEDKSNDSVDQNLTHK